uniref:Uncharacterized protein n=2 Tax=Lactuca sativa TaxID=4236 RepID=A0A9R1WU75_LACSA|nr:hypothetical protein LSAT_V11C900456190 [Lactuca sativa]
MGTVDVHRFSIYTPKRFSSPFIKQTRSPIRDRHINEFSFSKFLLRISLFLFAEMASAKLISSFIARRGFATLTQGSVSGSVRGSGAAVMQKGADDSKKSTTPWVPDPVTGYYKPEGQTNQVDAAELREQLLKHKTRGQ